MERRFATVAGHRENRRISMFCATCGGGRMGHRDGWKMLVTGASTGIGQALVRLAASRGFRVAAVARKDEDGYYYIAGRFKDMIISGGENIYAAEVEAVFREHEAVADAALIGLPDEKWGEVGLMIVACKPGQSAAAEELTRFCQGRLAKYKIPKRVEFVEALPYSPYGKVIKAELKKQWVVESGK